MAQLGWSPESIKYLNTTQIIYLAAAFNSQTKLNLDKHAYQGALQS